MGGKCSPQAWFILQALSAPRQSIRQDDRNLASLRSILVLRLWHWLQSHWRLSSVNARLGAPRVPGACDVDGEPVVQLVVEPAAALAYRDLDAGLLT